MIKQVFSQQPKQFSRRAIWVLGSLVVVLIGIFAFTRPSLADDVVGTADVIAGTLNMSATDAPAFPNTTLNGVDQTQQDTINIDVQDFTGSGAGWNLQITSTSFTNGSQTLSNTATVITGVSVSCDTGSCTDPTNALAGAYNITVPANTVAPSAAKFFSADAGTGLGDFTVTPTLQLSIPATTYAGTYQSTMTITIVSGP